MADEEGPSEAAQAFQELRAEVTLMRRAVERLTAERMEVPEPPDYSETLGVIANNITATAQRVDMLVKSPMLAMTPEQLAGRITAAASTARQEDRQTIATARTGLEDVTRQLHGYVVSARRGDEQNRWLMWSAIGGVVVGMMLWAVFAVQHSFLYQIYQMIVCVLQNKVNGGLQNPNELLQIILRVIQRNQI